HRRHPDTLRESPLSAQLQYQPRCGVAGRQHDRQQLRRLWRAGWMSRLSPRDEVAASVEVWQMWQRIKGYTDPTGMLNPFDASIAGGTDKTNLVKIGGQWTHLFGSSVEANINGGFVQSFATKSGIVATVTG